MNVRIDERTVRQLTCPDCGREFPHVTGFILEGEDARAIYYAACHGHPEHEAWIDVVLGTWGHDDPDEPADHVTFSCRLRVEGAMAVDAPVAVEGKAGMFGQRLTREAALAHPWLATFWEVIDFIAEEDRDVCEVVYGVES